MADFSAAIGQAYATEGAVIDLGRGVHEGALAPEAVVRLPLATMNRHGLIAGATGTGKTKTLQLITEQLSAQGVPVFVADVKGDLSGLAEPAEAGGPAEKRMGELGLPFAPAGFPVEFLSLGGIGPGVPVRATVSDFGPQLLAKVLGANETQESSLGLVFHYADTKGLPLLDLSDLRALLTYLDSKDGKAELEGIGGLSRATVGVLLRSLVGLETGGGTEFFGEPQLDIADLMRVGAGRARDRLLPGAAGRPGPARAVLDGDDVARRGAVRAAPGGGRPRQAQARLLPRRGAPAVRRRDRCVRGVRHADGAADPLQGRRRVLRHPGADGPAGVGARPARQPRPARAARLHAEGREGPARRRSRPTRRRSSTTSASC